MQHSDTELFKKRLLELAERSYMSGIFLFSDFLGLAEQSALAEIKPKLKKEAITKFGGTSEAERVMIRFGDPDELGYEVPFPIVCLKCEPKAPKFAQALSHRDFLGALMNLGIEREVLGDIAVIGNTAYIFAEETIAPYIMESLTRVRNTDVRLSVTEDVPCGELYKTEPVIIKAVGERIDAVIAKLYQISREDSLSLFRRGLVYVNGRLCENNSYTPKADERISVRGYGRFIYRGFTSETKKGKLNLLVEKYI